MAGRTKVFGHLPQWLLLPIMLFICHTAVSAGPAIITHVQGIEILPETIINAESSTIIIAGTADPDANIAIYSGGSKVAETTSMPDSSWTATVKNIMNGAHTFHATVDNWPRTSDSSNMVNVTVASTVEEPPAYMFYINYQSNRNDGELSTASSSVFITMFTNDPEGITTARISNDGLFYDTWPSPQLAPASTAWELESSPGLKTIHMKFYNADAEESDVITRQIQYLPGYTSHIGNNEDLTYPSASYDEYQGENKYGKPRIDATQPASGTSLKLVSP